MVSSGDAVAGQRALSDQSKPAAGADMHGTLELCKSLAAGGMAGMCAKTAVAPLDRMKILRQVRCGTYHHLSMAQTLRLMVAHEGLRGLYKGNGAQLVRVFPYAAVQFVSHEQFRRVLDVDRTRGAALMLSRVAAGSLAGLSAVACTYPLDLVRCRLSAQVHAARYQGIMHCIASVVRHEGAAGLFRGMWPTMLGIIPYGGISFASFEYFKGLALRIMPSVARPRAPGASARQDSHHTPRVNAPVKLVCGALAGAAAQTVSYPLDVVRRRMQLAQQVETAPSPLQSQPAGGGTSTTAITEPVRTQPPGSIAILRHMMRTEGWRGCFAGLSINYLRVAPMVGVSFTMHELLRERLGLPPTT